jgi:DNA-binding response OmpR family regulator
MKFFKTFRLDTANHLLYCNGDRVPMAPKPFDILAYLVEHAGRVVTQDEILQVLWSETYVNPEILRKYVLEIRKALGDRAEKPEFIEHYRSEATGLLLSSRTPRSPRRLSRSMRLKVRKANFGNLRL